MGYWQGSALCISVTHGQYISSSVTNVWNKLNKTHVQRGGQTNKHSNNAINKTDWEFYVKSFKFLGREYQTHTSTTTSHQGDMTEMSECHYNIKHIYQT